MVRFLLALISCLVLFSFQTEKCDCCTEQYNQFDFWLGDWEVFDTSGKKIGENLVTELEDGCVIQENWKSKNMTGTSYNYYDQETKTWNQLWIDNKGGNLKLAGGLQEGVMVMKDQPMTNKDGERIYNQISWSHFENGNVQQLWELYYHDGKLKGELFRGIYKPKQH